MMHTLNTFQSVSERDVDLLVLEELNVSDAFSYWMTSRVREDTATIKTVGAWHSVVDNVLGESDLVYIYQSDDLSSQAILIENKIDASAQPSQGELYRQRGIKGIEEGLWQDFKTCIIAPKAYLARNAEPYDAAISYEEMMAYFISCGEKRSRYRAQVLKDAIDKNRRGFVATVCPKTTEFATQYLNFISEQFPHLNPEPPKPRAAGHNWIHFHPDPSNKQLRIIHQIYGKSVKLQFLGQVEQFEQIKAQFKCATAAGFNIIKSEKSVNIETTVPAINIAEQEFEQVKAEIDLALGKVEMLHAWIAG